MNLGAYLCFFLNLYKGRGFTILNRTYIPCMCRNRLVLLLDPDSNLVRRPVSSSESLSNRLQMSFEAIDSVIDALIMNGFIASGERSAVTQDQIEDWIDGIASCTFTIALDGDVLLQSQILLQEQGFKLYPNFAKFLITALLKKVFENSRQIVSIEEYYMDTNYNSDPDLFDAKQVLLNVVIEE